MILATVIDPWTGLAHEVRSHHCEFYCYQQARHGLLGRCLRSTGSIVDTPVAGCHSFASTANFVQSPKGLIETMACRHSVLRWRMAQKLLYASVAVVTRM